MATDIPQPIDINYLRNLNPAQAAAGNVAQVVNQIIQYLKEQHVETINIKSLEKQFKDSPDS